MVDYWGGGHRLQVTKTRPVVKRVHPVASVPHKFFGSPSLGAVQARAAVITVAGTANRNRIGFEREFNRITEKIGK
jgi:hypothetical protein